MAQITNYSVVRNSLVDLEYYRLRLEENVAKLRKSVQHWQTWEAEYEGLKEEILGLGNIYTDAQLVFDSFPLVE